jgi:hypothetical protein
MSNQCSWIRTLIRVIDADPDPTFHPDANPVPHPGFQIKAQTLEKVGSYSIHFGLSYANWCGKEKKEERAIIIKYGVWQPLCSIVGTVLYDALEYIYYLLLKVTEKPSKEEARKNIKTYGRLYEQKLFRFVL